jgi:hypothetical protein
MAGSVSSLTTARHRAARPGVVGVTLGRFTALRRETFDPSGSVLSKGEYPVPPGGYPNTLLKMVRGQMMYTFAQDGPDAWAGLWDGRPPPPRHENECPA